MEKSDYIAYLRGRMLNIGEEDIKTRFGKSKEEYEQIIASTSDDDVMEFYRYRKDGGEWKTQAEMDDLIRECADPHEAFIRARTLVDHTTIVTFGEGGDDLDPPITAVLHSRIYNRQKPSKYPFGKVSVPES